MLLSVLWKEEGIPYGRRRVIFIVFNSYFCMDIVLKHMNKKNCVMRNLFFLLPCCGMFCLEEVVIIEFDRLIQEIFYA